jgi:hypothetical protein
MELGSLSTLTLNLYLFGLAKPSSKVTSILYIPLCLRSVGLMTIAFPLNLIKAGSGPPPTFLLFIKLADILIGRNSASSAAGS